LARLRSLEFLGIILNSNDFTARLSQERLTAIIEMLKQWLDRSACNLRELQSLIGTLSFAAKVVRAGRTFLRRTIDLLHATSSTHNESSIIKLSDGFRSDMRWWLSYVEKWNGLSVVYEAEWVAAADEVIRLASDACEVGGGAVCGTAWFSHPWTKQQLEDANQVKIHIDKESSSPSTTASHNNNKIESKQPTMFPPSTKKRRSMPYLELLALTMAAATWVSTVSMV
jgi:hypothetical protein